MVWLIVRDRIKRCCVVDVSDDVTTHDFVFLVYDLDLCIVIDHRAFTDSQITGVFRIGYYP